MKKEEKPTYLRILAITGFVSFALFLTLLLSPKIYLVSDFEPHISSVKYLSDSELNSEIRDMILLNDNAPIFLVTRWNYAGAQESIPTLSIPSDSVAQAPDAAMSDFRESFIKTDPSKAKILTYPNMFAYSSFMQDSADALIPESLHDAPARFEVFSQARGKVFSGLFNPVSVTSGRWTPAELSVLVSADGSWSFPVMSVSSGSEALDSEISEFLRKNLYSMNLQAGYYTIIVAP